MGDYLLYNSDCLESMKTIGDKTIDMIICDLPQDKRNTIIPFDLLWKEYKRIIKDRGVIALFGRGIFYVDLVQSNRKMFRYDLVWDKVLPTGFLNAKKMPMRAHEQIAIFYKKLPTYNPQFKVGNPLHGRGLSYKLREKNNIDDVRRGTTQKYPTSIIKFPKPHPSVSKHIAEKSVACIEWLIKTYSNEGDIILDNCMGSGTTGVACLNTNRKFIGIDIDEKCYDVALERLSNIDSSKNVESNSLKLF